MRSIIIITCLAVGFGFLLLLQQHPGKEEGQPATVARHLNLYHYFSGDLSGGLDEMLAEVNRQNQEEQVSAKGLDHEAFKTMILATLDNGNPPQLFSYWAGRKTQQLVDEGHLAAIDQLWLDERLDERFSSEVARVASTYNGHKYLLPIAQHLVVFFYHVPTFERLGLQKPETWPQFLDLLADLKKAGVTPLALGAQERWPAQFWFDYLLLRTAGPDYRQALMNTQAGYGDPQVREVFSRWSKLIEAGYFNRDANNLDWGEATRRLCQGEAAITLMGTWALQQFLSQECGLAEESGVDFFPFPIIDPAIPLTAVGPVDGIVLSATEDDQNFSNAILAYFSQPASQQLFSRGSGAFSPSSQVESNFYSPLRQRILATSNDASKWAFNYDLATPTEVAELGMDSFNELLAFPQLHQEILDKLKSAVDKWQSEAQKD